MANRIADRIATNIRHVDDMPPTKENQDKIAKADKAMRLSLSEFGKFQSLKTEAWLGSVLSQDEAQTVYEYLGETPEHFNRQHLGARISLHQLFGELLSIKIKRQRRAG